MSQATYLSTVNKSYVDVPVTDAGVDTAAFLDATEGLIKMFDLLGNPAFSIVQNDMNGNVAKIRTRFLATPDKSATLESLVENEKGEKKRTATEGLLWLLRGLRFTQLALTRSQADKSEELNVSFTKAYEESLKKFHSFVVKPLFTLAMKSCPYRAAFYEKLGSPLDVVEKELQAWLAALEAIITKLEKFYEAGNHAKGF
ncbi:glycolipid transfer protein [Meredithblackwellia eburnea MCA 4105]